MSSRNSSLLATIIVVTIIGTLLLAVLPSFGYVPAPTNASEVWVDPAFTVDNAGGHTFGNDAFNTISEGVYNVNAGGIVHVSADTYNENVVIDKSLTLSGANAGISASGTRGDESIIQPVDGSIGIAVNANDVTVDGFTVSDMAEPINVTGDGVTIANNIVNIDTTDYLINVQGNQAHVIGNRLYANEIDNAVINVTGNQTTVSSNDLEINQVGFNSMSENGFAVLVTGNSAQVTYNTLNVTTSGNDIINVYGDEGMISGNTINSGYVYDYAIEYNQNNGDNGALATSNDGTITNNVINAGTCYPLIENNGNNTVIQGNTLNVTNTFDNYVIESYGSGTQIIGNSIGNETTIAEYAIYSSGWDGIAKNTQIIGNTIILNSSYSGGIYTEGIHSQIIGNTIDTTAGFLMIGIYNSGYNAQTDSNSVRNASIGIFYVNEFSPESSAYVNTKALQSVKALDMQPTVKTDSHVMTAEQISALPDGQKAKAHTHETMATVQSVPVHAQSNLPAYDFATIQNNLVDNSNMSYMNYGILYMGLTGAIADNVVYGGTANATMGIAAIADNVTVTGNAISGVTMPDANLSELSGAALVIEPLYENTVNGNAYLANNRLTNNRVQMVTINTTVFNLDNAGTIVSLNNSTLSQIISNNALDHAYWIVTEDGQLKTIGDYGIGLVVVYGSGDDAASMADIEAGDRVVESTMNTYTYDLVAGWNLISVPLNVADNSVAGFFPTDVMSEVWDVWGWDDASQTWTYYSPDPNTPYTGFEPIATMDAGKAYWVNMDSSATFTIEGSVPVEAPNAPFTLVSNWNFVGLTGLTPSTPDVMYPTAWDVWGWNAEAQHWTYYSSDPNTPYSGYEAMTTIQPGLGQWVNI